MFGWPGVIRESSADTAGRILQVVSLKYSARFGKDIEIRMEVSQEHGQ